MTQPPTEPIPSQPTPRPTPALSGSTPPALGPISPAAGAPPDALPPGARCGAYVVESFIGRGGMGTVYRGRHADLGRPAAIKVLVGAASPSASERLVREARTVARLAHPGIVRVYDVGLMADGRPWLAMELIDGEGLDRVVARDAMPLADRIRLVAQAARALHAAHEAGIIHRDVKPQNIIVERGGARAKVVDFGIGKTIDATTGLTATGQLVGTVGYMAPELVRQSGEAGPIAEVYALGATLYEVVTGRAPFQRNNVAATIHEILHADLAAPSAETARSLGRVRPEALDAICFRALAKDPAVRQGTALAFALELEDALAGRAVRPAPRRRLGDARVFASLVRVTVAGLVGGALFFVGLAVGLAARGRAPEEVGPASVADVGPGPVGPTGDAATLDDGATPTTDTTSAPAPPGEAPGSTATPVEPARPELTSVVALEAATVIAAHREADRLIEALAEYRALGVGARLDRLVRVVEDLPAETVAELWGWAAIDRDLDDDLDGVARAQARLYRAAVAAPNPSVLLPRWSGAMGWSFSERMLRGDPLFARQRLAVGRRDPGPWVAGCLPEGATETLGQLVALRALVPTLVRAAPDEDVERPPDLTLLGDPTALSARFEEGAARVRAGLALLPPRFAAAARDVLETIEGDVGEVVGRGLIRLRCSDGAAEVALHATPRGEWRRDDRSTGLIFAFGRESADEALVAGTAYLALARPERFATIDLEIGGDPPLLALGVAPARGAGGVLEAAPTGGVTVGIDGVRPVEDALAAGLIARGAEPDPTASSRLHPLWVRLRTTPDGVVSFIGRRALGPNGEPAPTLAAGDGLRILLGPGTVLREVRLRIAR